MNTRELKWLSLWQATAEYLEKENLYFLFFVYSPYFDLASVIAPIKLHWSNLRQINKPANKNLFKGSVVNINFLDFLWKCFDPLNRYLSCFSCHVSIKTTTEGSWIFEVKEILIVIPSLWSDDMYTETIERFGNSHHEGTDQISCSF